MKNWKKWGKTLCQGLALALSILAAGLTVSAAETAALDMNASGSISLTLADSNGTALSGGAVTLYQVATLSLENGDMTYTLTGDFSGCTAALDVTDTGLAAQLAAYAEAHQLSGTAASPGQDGKISFSNLALGLYLIVQTEASENYNTISPFVVTVPMEKNGEWVYAVDASPKVGTVTPTPTTEPSEPSTPTDPTLPQTGQATWPIFLLAFAGVGLLALGAGLKWSDRHNHAA